MTVDKILVIVVLVFSVVFVVAAISGYTNARNMSATNEAKINALIKDVSNKDLKINQLDGSNKDLLASLNAESTAKDQAITEKEDLKRTIADLQGQVGAKDQAIQGLNGKIMDLDTTVTSLQTKVETLNATLQALIKDRDDLNEKVRQAGITIDARDKTIKEREADVAARDATIKEKVERIRILEHPGEQTTTEFKLDCTITEVKRDKGYALVSLDKGGKAGLKVDMKLFVWNSADGYKGRVTVVEVHDDTAFAKIDLEEPGKEIKPGDTASVQNF